MEGKLQRAERRKVHEKLVCLVGSDAEARRDLRQMLTELGYRVAQYVTAGKLLKDPPGDEAPLVVLFEFASEGEEEYRSLEKLIRKIKPTPVVVISSNPDPAAIVRAVRLGAADYLIRPLQDDELARSVGGALLEPRDDSSPPGRGKDELDPPAFIRVSAAVRELEQTARKVADSDVTILICGESGSGKEVLARYIHHLSPRANEAFVKVNCAALPEELLESELFGYERGAFTGAMSQKLGKFELAEGGTILLDEITEMSQRLQAKFLHVLQDKQFNRLGGNRDIRVDVRVLAASNRHLEREVEEGRFREDLYFRLKVIDLHVPPLRERREEIPLLIDYFLERFTKQYDRPLPVLSQQFLNLLLAYRWDGNVRELENMLKRIVILGDEDSVMREILSRSVPGDSVDSPQPAVPQPAVEETLNLKDVARRAALAAERSLILATLDKTRWNRRKASQLLGVSYKTLITKIKDCGLREG